MARRLGILLLFLNAALLAATAYWLLFTVFMTYDDEGYVLISLRHYAAHGGLYAAVYSQYGPFFYFIHDLGHRLFGYAFTNTTGRLITLLCWMTAAGGAAHLVWRQTRSVALAAFALSVTYFHLWLMVSEPSHPGGLIAVLVALGAWLGARLVERRAPRGLALLAGGLGAALLLTKVNVGVFFLAGAGAWFATRLADLRHARLATAATAAILVALPFALMRADLAQGWGLLFSCLSATASLTMLALAWRGRTATTTWRDAGAGATALALVAGVVLGSVCLRGTTARELLEGILLGPLRHPGVYHFAPDWLPGAAGAGSASLVLAALFWFRAGGHWLKPLLLALRLTLAAAYSLACLEWLPFTAQNLTMSWLVPLAWIFAVRLAPAPGGEADRTDGVAAWIGLLLVLQYLHAFPVAGSQVAWGTFLVAPLIALGLHDAGRCLAGRQRAWVPGLLAAAAFTLAVGLTGRLAGIGYHRYTAGRPLRLAGAEDLRLPEDFASALRVLTLNASAQGDLLFSLPGMFSFNTWTGLPAPTLADVTHWFSLLDRTQQAGIAAALARSARPVLIVQRGMLDYLAENHFSLASPLHDYLDRNFERVFRLHQYEFWVRRGRHVAALGLAEQLVLEHPAPGLPAAKLEFTAAIPAGRTIASVELATFDEPPRVLRRWAAATGPLLATGLKLDGTPVAGDGRPVWGRPVPPLARFSLPLARSLTFDGRNSAVYVRDAHGALLAEARFTD